MRKNLQAILFLRPFAMGTLSPVLILLLTTHGATVQTASLFIGISSAIIILAEFPSGVFADLFGRKRSFVVSLLLQITGFSLLLASRTPGVLAAVMVLYGLSRAFASGSIEALAIDEIQDQALLPRVTARLGILESAGLAGGALLGGLLAGIGTDYSANLLFSIGGYITILLLTLFTVRESKHLSKSQDAAGPRLQAHLQKSFSFVFRSRTIRMLFVLCFFTGFAMVTVETYWQPALKTFTTESWRFGLVNCIGFSGVILGSKLAEFLLLKRPQAGIAVFLGTKAVMSCFLALLITTQTQLSFVSVYLLWYVFLGGNGVAEQTLLNREAPAAQRASILSLFSFDMQIGALTAALFCYGIASVLNYRYNWLFAAGILAAVTLAFAMLALRRRGREQNAHYE